MERRKGERRAGEFITNPYVLAQAARVILDEMRSVAHHECITPETQQTRQALRIGADWIESTYSHEDV